MYVLIVDEKRGLTERAEDPETVRACQRELATGLKVQALFCVERDPEQALHLMERARRLADGRPDD